jgi:tetratricopeptide (TPR) repeat protein
MSVPPSPNDAQSIDIEKTIARARTAWGAARADEAEMACRQVLGVWPGQTDATYLLGLMTYAFGNLDLAILHVREASRSPRAPAVYFSDFAEMCRQKGLLAEGQEAGRRAVALAPNFAAAWNNLGIVLQEMLKLDESQLCLERALALEPNNPETLNNLANTLKRLGLAAEAEKRWNAALALKPDYAEAYSNLSNLLNDQGEYDRAESMARRAIELNPRLADAYVNLAAVRTVRHRHTDALHVLDALLAFAPGHARALRGLWRSRSWTGWTRLSSRRSARCSRHRKAQRRITPSVRSSRRWASSSPRSRPTTALLAFQAPRRWTRSLTAEHLWKPSATTMRATV